MTANSENAAAWICIELPDSMGSLRPGTTMAVRPSYAGDYAAAGRCLLYRNCGRAAVAAVRVEGVATGVGSDSSAAVPGNR